MAARLGQVDDGCCHASGIDQHMEVPGRDLTVGPSRSLDVLRFRRIRLAELEIPAGGVGAMGEARDGFFEEGEAPWVQFGHHLPAQALIRESVAQILLAPLREAATGREVLA